MGQPGTEIPGLPLGLWRPGLPPNLRLHPFNAGEHSPHELPLQSPRADEMCGWGLDVFALFKGAIKGLFAGVSMPKFVCPGFVPLTVFAHSSPPEARPSIPFGPLPASPPETGGVLLLVRLGLKITAKATSLGCTEDSTGCPAPGTSPQEPGIPRPSVPACPQRCLVVGPAHCSRSLDTSLPVEADPFCKMRLEKVISISIVYQNGSTQGSSINPFLKFLMCICLF